MRFPTRGVWMGLTLFTSPSGWSASSETTPTIAATLQEQALPELIHSITEKKPTRPRLRIIGDLQDQRATPYLLEAYHMATAEGIRCKVIQSLGKLRDPSLFRWYVERLKDPSIGIQCFALWALGELRLPQAAAPLRRKLWSPNRYVQMTAIDALGKTGKNPTIAAQLGVFLQDDDVQLRFLAAKALSGVAGTEDVPDLLHRLLDEPSVDVQNALARTIGRVGGNVAAGHLIEVLKNPSSPAREHWAEVGLKAIQPEIAVPALAPLLEGPDFRLRISASRILSDVERPAKNDPEAPWRDTVKKWARSSDPVTRETAERLLERTR